MGPLEYILIALGAALVCFVAVIAARTAAFRPKDGVATSEKSVEIDEEKVVSNLSELIKCRTVSKYTHEEEDEVEFEIFINHLNTFPSCVV